MPIELDALIKLQNCEGFIRKLQDSAIKAPEKLEPIKKKLSESVSELETSQEKLTQTKKEWRALEGELEDLRLHVGKYKEQLMKVKTNKEYTAVLKEIELHKSKASDHEDVIIRKLDETDKYSGTIEKNKAIIEENEKILEEETKKTEEEIKKLEDEIHRLSEDANKLREKIAPDLLKLYNETKAVRQGIAMAEIRNGSCGVCNLRIRPQVIEEVKVREHLLICDSCKRILYCSWKKGDFEGAKG